MTLFVLLIQFIELNIGTITIIILVLFLVGQIRLFNSMELKTFN